MGFFSDLKEDLSQAVNELMPEEELDAVLAGNVNEQENASVDDQLSKAGVTDDMTDQSGMPAAAESGEAFDLSSMLDKLDDVGIDEPVEEEVITPVFAEEPVTEASVGALEEPAAEEIPSVMEETSVFEPAAEPVFGQEISEQAEETAADQTGDAAVENEPIIIPQEVEEPVEDKTTIQNDEREEKKMDVQTNRVAVDETAVVTEGMTITGDIISEGSMELIGTVNGNLDILGKLNITGCIQGNSKAAEIYAEGAKITGEVNSQGSVKIGQSSVVIGNIFATSAVIAGAVKGDIDVQGPVILDTTAIVMGNIKSKSVQINNGAVIEGMCSQCYADVNPTSFFEEFKKKK